MNNQVIISTDTGLGNSSCIFSVPWEFRQAALSTYRDLVQTVAVYKRGKQMVDDYRSQNKEVNITISSLHLGLRVYMLIREQEMPSLPQHRKHTCMTNSFK